MIKSPYNGKTCNVKSPSYDHPLLPLRSLPPSRRLNIDRCIRSEVHQLRSQVRMYEKKLPEGLKLCHSTVLCAKNTTTSSGNIKNFWSHLCLWPQLSSAGERKKPYIALNSPKYHRFSVKPGKTYSQFLTPSGVDLYREGNAFSEVLNYPF